MNGEEFDGVVASARGNSPIPTFPHCSPSASATRNTTHSSAKSRRWTLLLPRWPSCPLVALRTKSPISGSSMPVGISSPCSTSSGDIRLRGAPSSGSSWSVPLDRGAGVGSSLITRLLDRLRGEGVSRVRLAYVEGNERSRHFWRKCGFFEAGAPIDQGEYKVVPMERSLAQTISAPPHCI